ncbi:MAG: signal peptidase II [Candidatus Krumholzibacteria bacterium]|nr:signal peptidase II [Candidatus Krumholzibacteria bacterium]MDH4337198.1 signal peptidase II [Candidatus Krumholzibacteria bacterium]MDH5268661.1 signal peptidase II [Candidatus Krumholzibacteria bacterium]
MRFLVPAALVVVIDQLTKQLIWRNGQNYEIVAGFLNITLVKNAGAAFGIFQGGRLFFIVASVVALVLISLVAFRLPRAEKFRRLCLGLVLGGAIGNLVDRVLHGEVIDFIQIGFTGHYWPVFNVADMAVTIGAALLVLVALRTKETHVDAPATDGALVAPRDQRAPER